MKTALLKNTFREIKNTKARFISILMIIALGVGFFVGVKSTSPSMAQMAVDYYAQANLMDFRLVSTVGFDEDDVDAIAQTKGVRDVMPSYYADVSVNHGETGSTLRLMSAPVDYEDHKAISQAVVVEGQMPQNSGEIAVESSSFADYKIGDKITISPTVGDVDVTEQLKVLEYTVVGLVKSPLYISLERGTTNVGNGKIDEFAYIAEQDFKGDRYTVVYATLDTKGKVLSPFDTQYEDKVEQVAKALEDTSDAQVEAFCKDNIEEAYAELDDAQKELDDEKAKAQKELDDAQTKLDKAEDDYYAQINSAQAQIDEAQIKIDNGRKELESQWAEYEKTVDLFNQEIAAGKAQLDLAQAQYDEGVAKVGELKDQRTNLEQELTYIATNAIYTVISQLSAETDPTVSQTLSDYASSVTAQNAEAVLVEVKVYLNTLFGTAFDPVFDAVLPVVGELSTNVAALSQAIDAAQSQLDEAYIELEKGRAEIQTQEKNTLAQLSKYKSELESAEDELDSAAIELENSRAELETARSQGLSEINDNKDKLAQSKKDADKQFRKAQKKIDDAREELDSIGDIKWYVFDRGDNPGYSGFEDNIERVDAVASVFPLFFLLVAMLVCLTTMTRLVEEKRTEIGTLKALGYSDRSITFKFVAYACLAALLGCLLGCFSCVPTLPRVIYNAYGMLYNMSDTIDVVVDISSLVLAVVAAFVCCAFVTLAVCYKTLHHKPSTLMRPKAPKAGKRILLERMTFLWRRFNFSSKVTWRNLFRYKSRLFMTAIGIAGCTALLLTAFGLYDSINDVVGIQFEDLSKYNTMIIVDEDKSQEQMESILDDVESDDRFVSSAALMQKFVSVTHENKTVSNDVYMMVIEDPHSFQQLMTIRERVDKQELTIGDEGVIITEKLAKMLDVSVGDTVEVGDDGDTTTVTGVAENYVLSYVYISAQAYQDLTGDSASYNTIYAKAQGLTEDMEKALGTDYLEKDYVAAISFTSTIIKEFKDMISSMNMIVLVMIISAGALAIVVLYNLTNINLAERNREIATIKVLGFNHHETSAFVYRENIILTIFGTLVGLVLGIWLWQFVVKTVEIDTIMFGRQIHALSFVLSAALTAFFSLVVNFIMYFRIKTIDMVESLKSIE